MGENLSRASVAVILIVIYSRKKGDRPEITIESTMGENLSRATVGDRRERARGRERCLIWYWHGIHSSSPPGRGQGWVSSKLVSNISRTMADLALLGISPAHLCQTDPKFGA